MTRIDDEAYTCMAKHKSLVKAAPEQPGTPRVAMVIPRYWPIIGGAECQCRLLAATLQSEGKARVVWIITRRIAGTLPRREGVDGIRVMRMGLPGMSRYREYLFAFEAAMFLLLRSAEYDIIHCHTASIIPGFMISVLSRIIRRPVVLKISTNGELVRGAPRVERDSSLFRPLLTWVRRAMARVAVSRAEIIALNSQGVQEATKAGARNIHVLPNGVDADVFRPPTSAEKLAARSSMSIPSSATVLAFSGRLVRNKGVDTLLEALLARHRQEGRCEDRLVTIVIGGTEYQTETMEECMQEAQRQLGPALRIAGFTANVVRYLHAADAFVFPSRTEGMPNAVLEALSVGLSCILSDIPPHRELQATNPLADITLFETGSAASLTAALDNYLKRQPPSPTRSGLSASHDIRNVSSDYARLYTGACQRQPRARR